jgi:hypothetical protein
MLTYAVEDDRVRIGDRFAVRFQRTLRVPDDGRTYPLPPGLGPFALRRVEDFAGRVPESWLEEGGVILPMYQSEALWLEFHAAWWKPNAVKVGVGRVNALTGAAWDEGLQADPQDYVVCPTQPWLDGIKMGDGRVRQFVAMPLGAGYTVEAQVRSGERFGGIQITVFEPRPGLFPDQPPPDARVPKDEVVMEDEVVMAAFAPAAMGLAAGGSMHQKIYPDPHGFATWDQGLKGSLHVHIVNSASYRELTGTEPPPSPVSAKTYTEYGFPWFALYDEAAADLPTRDELARVKSVRELDESKGDPDGGDEGSVDVPESQVRKLGYPRL